MHDQAVICRAYYHAHRGARILLPTRAESSSSEQRQGAGMQGRGRGGHRKNETRKDGAAHLLFPVLLNGSSAILLLLASPLTLGDLHLKQSHRAIDSSRSSPNPSRGPSHPRTIALILSRAPCAICIKEQAIVEPRRHKELQPLSGISSLSFPSLSFLLLILFPFCPLLPFTFTPEREKSTCAVQCSAGREHLQ
jgi:hypothetical protein